MIQRIQSIFLLLAAAANFSLFGLPFAATQDDVIKNEIFADHVFNLQDHIGLLIFFTLAGVLALVAIFLFRNRRLQMRLTIFSVIALIFGMAFGVVYFLNNSGGLENVVVYDRAGAYVPIAGLVFDLLAYRFILKDERLVQSMDRLR
jgi:hypothetical protein